MGLQQDTDWVPQCMGKEFNSLIASLINNQSYVEIDGAPRCDVAGSIITITHERHQLGIEFSRGTSRPNIAVLVYSRLRGRGVWAFFEPLALWVWLALLATIFVVPFLVFFFESMFSSRCAPTCG